MPFLVALLGIAAAAYFWANRARNAKNVAMDVADMANDVRLAARRFGFTRRANIHPGESVDDPRLAMATIATAFIELDDLPTQEQRRLLNVQLRSKLRLDAEEAQEMEVLGRWLMTECGGPEPAIARMSRKLFKLEGVAQAEPLMDILKQLVADNGLSDRQRSALEDIQRAFRLR